MKISDPASVPPETWRLGLETRMLVSALSGAAAVHLRAMARHRRRRADACAPVEEVFTVREGEAEMWIAGERAIVTSGQSLIVAAGRLHGFRNCGTTTLHLHAVLASPILEATIEGAAEVTRQWPQD